VVRKRGRRYGEGKRQKRVIDKNAKFFGVWGPRDKCHNCKWRFKCVYHLWWYVYHCSLFIYLFIEKI